MWRDGALVSLAAVLCAIDENDWVWQVREFSGVGELPGSSSMVEFEASVRKSPLEMSWTSLLRFAEAIEQTWDCSIVGLNRVAGSSPTSTAKEDSVAKQVVIEAFDSTTWELTSPDPFLLERIAKRLNVTRTRGFPDGST